jgi:hypothetical protein
MMTHLPDIMEDVAIDSKDKLVVCTMCQGEGKLHDVTVNRRVGAICPECHGDGRIRIQGDKEARNLTFEAVGLKKSGGSINVLQVNDNSRRGVPSMEDQVLDVEKIFDADYTSDADTQNFEEGDPDNGNNRESGVRENHEEVEAPGLDADSTADAEDPGVTAGEAEAEQN